MPRPSGGADSSTSPAGLRTVRPGDLSTTGRRCPRIRAGCPQKRVPEPVQVRTAEEVQSREDWVAERPATPTTRRSVGVDQLADRGDLAAQLVVDGALAGDLVAGVE